MVDIAIHYLLFTIHRCFLLPLLLLTRGLCLQALQPSTNIAIANIDAVDICKRRHGVFEVAHLFIGSAKLVFQGLGFFGVAAGCIKTLLEPTHSRLWHTLLSEAMAQHIATLKVSRRAVSGRGQSSCDLEFPNS